MNDVQRTDYQAWLIDLDGTLYRQRPVRLAMALELLLTAPHQIRTIQTFRREQERLRKECACGGVNSSSACPYQRQLELAAAALGRQPTELASIVHEWMERRPGKWLRLFKRQKLLAEITRFRSAGGRTALVSDYPASTKLEEMGIATLFDVVVASGEAGGPAALKPSPAGYLLAAERLGVRPNQCLVIGDRPDADGLAAQQAAMSFRLVP